MNKLNIPLIQKVAVDILTHIPRKPFFCLPLSALLYAILKDKYGINAKLVAGHLTYKGRYIFKHDFKISENDHSKFKLWGGHAWVEIENTVWDLSFSRSLYSEKFTKPYKQELLKIFGDGRGFLVVENRKIQEVEFEYHPVEVLADELATRIILGIDTLIKTEW